VDSVQTGLRTKDFKLEGVRTSVGVLWFGRKYGSWERSTTVRVEVPGTDGEFEPVRDGVPESTATTGNRKASYCSRLMDASELTTPL